MLLSCAKGGDPATARCRYCSIAVSRRARGWRY